MIKKGVIDENTPKHDSPSEAKQAADDLNAVADNSPSSRAAEAVTAATKPPTQPDRR